MSHLSAPRGQSKTKKHLIENRVKAIPRPFYASLARKDSVALRPAACSSIGLPDSRYQKGDYIRLRCSPHNAVILRAEPYIVDENGRSLLLHSAEKVKPKSRKSRFSRSYRKSVNMASPRTPVNQQGLINGRRSIIPDGDDRHGPSMTPDVPSPPPKDTPRPKKVSPLDKDLPAKPALRYASSPQRRGLLDATDSAAKRMTVSYPPLKPSNVVRHRPSLSDSSFKVAPSLKSARGSVKYEVGTASTKQAQKVQGLPVTITSQRNLRQTSSGYSLAGSRPSAPTSNQRMVSLSHGGHIGAYKNGSPIQRYPSSSKVKALAKTPVKFNRRKTRDFQVLSDNCSDDDIDVNADITQTGEIVEPNKENFDISGDTLAKNHAAESPARSDGGRRYVKLGVGPTVRYSKDAREVLMGKSPNVKELKNTSKFGGSSKVLNDSPYPRIPLPQKVDKEVKSRFQASDPPASRLTRPTASSAARTQDSKAKIDSRKSSIVTPAVKKAPEVKKVSKGIRSRVSDLLHGRRRSAQPSVDKTPPLVHNNKKYDVRDMTAFKVILTGEQADKLTSDRDQHQAKANSQETAEAHYSNNTARRLARSSAIPTRLNPDEDCDHPPPPPPMNSIRALRAHNLEDAAALQTEDARLEAAIASVQASLDQIIATTQGIEYPGFRNVVEPVIRSLAASILSAQNARVAVVGLGNASQRVMTDTLIMSEAISRAATEARRMVDDIETMIPEVQTAGGSSARA
ncbi:hypothetical protein BKA65DRAFT_569242 [Rhexocercosporidium sp. MPI-PUGE-AT-0058]|nr:hypothetical protein BKA65DRAFT_569242 [Rhexocercosporidium sp. MPI-PUGE-AT-0058]